jgi:hypothetical protein
MARLAIQLAGGFIGANIPGVGFGIGAFVGGIIGNLLFPPPGNTTIGPRLQDLSVNASTYGKTIPFGYGAMLYNGNIIWSPGLEEHEKSETVGGGGLLGKGGGPSQTTITFTYTASYAIIFAEGPISAYSRIWGDTKLLTDPFLKQAADGTIEGDLDVLGKFDRNMTKYLGTETQLPDATMEAEEGVGNISAHRGLAYIMFTDLPLEDFGNRIPNTRAEIFTNSSDVFPFRVHTALTTTNVRWSMLNFRRTRVFAWDIISGAMHVAELKITDLSIIKSTVIPAPGGGLSFAPVSQYFRWAFDVFDNFYWPVKSGTNVRRFLKVNLDSLSWFIGADNGASDNTSSTTFGCGNYIDGQGIARTRAMYGTRNLGPNIHIYKKFPDLMGGLPDPRGIDIDQTLPGEVLGTEITIIKDSVWVFQLGNLGPVIDKDGRGWIFRGVTGNAVKFDDTNVIQLDEFGVRFNSAGMDNPDGFTDFSWAHKEVAFDITTNSCVIMSDKFGSDQIWFARYSFDDRKIDAQIDGSVVDIGDLQGTLNTYFDRRRTVTVGHWMDHSNQFLENPNIWFTVGDEASVNDSQLILELDVATFTLAGRGPDEVGGYQHLNWESFADGENSLWGGWYNQVNHSIVYLNSNDQSGGGTPPTDARSYFLDRIGITPGDVVNLRVIVDDILDRAGLLSGDRDTAALGREAAADPAFPEFKDVIGFAVDKQQTARSVLEMLSRAFVFHLVETDWLIKAIWRGNVIVNPDVVPLGDLGAHNVGTQPPAQITETRQMESELASKVTVTYIDQNREYQDNTQTAKRADELVKFQEINNINYPVVINHSQARLMAFIALYTGIVGRRTFEFTLPPKYIKYDPGDFLSIPVGGVQERVVIDSTDLASSGLVKMRATLDDPEVFQPPFGDIATIGTNAPVPQKSTLLDQSGLTGSVLFLMDIPLLRDTDDGPGEYMASAGPSGWPGDIVFKSTDGFDYLAFESFVASQNSFSGAATTVLADGITTIFDNGSSVTVFLTNSDHTLVSVTEAQVLEGANPALLGNEIIQFRDVVDNGDGTWTLSGFLRGRKGTEQHTSTHVVGERFVFLDKATTRRIADADFNLLRFYKAVTIGASLDDAGAIGFTNTGAGRKPYSVVHVAVTRNGSNDIIITWIRRTRVGGQWVDIIDAPLSETSESYEVDVVDGFGGAIKRTLAVTAQTATYLIADQTTDFGGAKDPAFFEIYQMSSTVGRGFKTEFTG